MKVPFPLRHIFHFPLLGSCPNLMHLCPLGHWTRTHYSNCGNGNFKCRATLTSYPVAASAWMFKQGTGTGLLPIKSLWKFMVHCLSPWPASPTGWPFLVHCVRIKAQPRWVRAKALSVPRHSRGQAGDQGSAHSLRAWNVLPCWALKGFFPCLVQSQDNFGREEAQP